MSGAFDETALMDNVDGDLEFLEESVAMLGEDSPALLEAIRAAAVSGDAAALVRPAHTLKGMCSNFCAEPAETAARELEAIARAQRLAEVQPAVDRVEHETQQLLEALERYVRTKLE